jgi:hypothetical protein
LKRPVWVVKSPSFSFSHGSVEMRNNTKPGGGFISP